MTSFDPQTTLLVVALENELPRDMVAGWTIIYKGVGKVNAAIALRDAITLHFARFSGLRLPCQDMQALG